MCGITAFKGQESTEFWAREVGFEGGAILSVFLPAAAEFCGFKNLGFPPPLSGATGVRREYMPKI
jgi:hypothetical protein